MSQSTSAESNGKEVVQGITGISVRGYKSLYEECSIEIRPLTILAGANSSGKSSIMQPLLLLKQTLEAAYDPGSLLLNGPNVQFTSSTQFLSKNSIKKHTPSIKESTSSFTVKLKIDSNTSLANTFEKSLKHSIHVVKTDIKENTALVEYSRKMSRQSILFLLGNYYINRGDREMGNFFLEGKGKTVEKLEWNISRYRCFLNLECKSEGYLQVGDELLPVPTTLYNSSSRMSLFESQICRLIHVPGVRVNPDRTYEITAIGSGFPGGFENYVASIISYWKETKDKRLRDLGQALETLGLTWKVDARKVNGVQIELRVGRLPRSGSARDMVSIADVGFGVSQVLPVLVALLVAEPGQLVYLEQPEMHLHPRAQAALAEILADAAKRGVRVVVETHSELLLLAVQSLVAEGKLSPDLVKLHWFTRREDGVTEVNSANLDDAGAFGDWPEDFGDVSMKLESRYLDAAEARLWKRSHGG